MIFTDELIANLITCPKTIIDTPKRILAVRGSDKIKFSLESIDKNHSFIGFISKNQTFQENFSIGLVYNPKDEKGKIVLLRVNGPHGPNESIPHHNGPHVHIATADRINSGLKPEGSIEVNVPYVSIEDAIQYYVRRINIDTSDSLKHFPPPDNQLNITFEEGDNI